MFSLLFYIISDDYSFSELALLFQKYGRKNNLSAYMVWKRMKSIKHGSLENCRFFYIASGTESMKLGRMEKETAQGFIFREHKLGNLGLGLLSWN
ncbi:MAG: hypothetical protein BAA00_12945 [Parageobacillus thermoglucosidasius]|nr:MAG: hypothetical protein BAA00_12945 [Parageobacillus thermoglucosidasius]